jgi:hypothetical protein
MKISQVLTRFLILSIAAAASPLKYVYRNVDYGITLPVPDMAQTCPVSSGDTTRQGVTLLLGTKDMSLC